MAPPSIPDSLLSRNYCTFGHCPQMYSYFTTTFTTTVFEPGL